jgi:hypothetical protein
MSSPFQKPHLQITGPRLTIDQQAEFDREIQERVEEGERERRLDRERHLAGERHPSPEQSAIAQDAMDLYRHERDSGKSHETAAASVVHSYGFGLRRKELKQQLEDARLQYEAMIARFTNQRKDHDE